VNLKGLPRPQLAIASIGAFVIVLLGGWFLVIGPKRHEASSLSAQASDLRNQIDEAQAGGSSSDQQRIRVADLFELSRAMPDTTDVPDVLLQLSEVASETGITFSSVTPGNTEAVGNYEKLPIDLVFEGRFYDLADFLYRLRNLVGVHDGVLATDGRLFAVDSISFAEGDVTFPQVQANIRVDAFIYGNGTETSPPPPEATQSAAPVTPATAPAAPTETGSAPVPIAPNGASAAPARGTG
jgi:type IV pilus assembly protein PilO